MNPSARFGYAYIALFSVLLAISGTASKHLFLQGVTPYRLVQFRTAIASAVLLAWLAAMTAFEGEPVSTGIFAP